MEPTSYGSGGKRVVIPDDTGKPKVFVQYNDNDGEVRFVDDAGYVYRNEGGRPMPMGGARVPLDQNGKPTLPQMSDATPGQPGGAGDVFAQAPSQTVEDSAALGAETAYRLGTGQSIRTDQGTLTPRQFLEGQYSQGLPLGLAYKDATDNHRANSLSIANSAPSHQASADAFGRLASGDAGRAALGEANRAWDRASVAGAPSFGSAQVAANSALGTAGVMTADMGALRAAANGTVPSAAAIQQRQGISDAVTAQQSLAASARGGNLAAAMRSAAGAGQGVMSRGIADAAALRANEQAAARSALTQAQGVQGGLFNNAANTFTGIGTAVANRDANVATGRTQTGTVNLQSQQAGAAGLGATADRERAAAVDQASREADDRATYYNTYLQMLNGLNGNAAAVIQGNTARTIANQQAAAQDRAAIIGLGGTLIGGVTGAV